MERKTDWMQTYTGRRFYPFEPSGDDMCIQDIAHALSLLCRYNGHCLGFYSVAQHSVMVSLHCKYPLHGLLHDADEAYLGDISRPVKRSLKVLGVTALEEAAFAIQQVVAYKFGLIWSHEAEADVKHWDNILLSTEARDMMSPMIDGTQWTSVDIFDKLSDEIIPVSPEEAEWMFLNRFEDVRCL